MDEENNEQEEIHAKQIAIAEDQKCQRHQKKKNIMLKTGRKQRVERTTTMVRKHTFCSNRFSIHSRMNAQSSKTAAQKWCSCLRSQEQVPPWRREGLRFEQELSRCAFDVCPALELQCKSDDLISLQLVINSIYKIQLIRSKLIFSISGRWYTVMGGSVKGYESKSDCCSS